MTQEHPSTGSPAHRPLVVWVAALIVLVMLVAYAIVWMLGDRQDLLSENIEWFRAVVTTLARRGE